ncbi:MAG TPA: hypothetical protein VGO50_09245 [Pyrinomonadaceae bacterium]|jgi:hypothetical protein|nr:hypothetical protein [Pyrinomonadaceae bacterium]
MGDINNILEKFFREYEARTNRALSESPEVNAKETAEAFANCFVEASPVGINYAMNDEKFLAVIPQGYEHYRNIGTKAMNITGMEFTAIDDLHSMAKIHWDSRYEKKDGGKVQIEFDVTYFVQVKDGKPKYLPM